MQRRSEQEKNLMKLANKRKSIWKDRGSWELLLLCIPALAGYILFNYIPMISAIVIPFKDYKFSKGIFGSEWVGFANFEWLLSVNAIGRVVRNTLAYGAWFMVIGPFVNVVIALLLFEIRSRRALKCYQTIITFPNFMSYVVVGYVTYAILSPRTGALNQLLGLFGVDAIDVYMKAGYWPFILTIVNIWKGVGMGSMMYFASLVGIDGSLYEAAEIDGANRFQKMKYISIPHLIPLVCIFMILGAGGLVGGNFDLFYIIPRNSTILYPTTDILPTYVYRALHEANYSTGATVGFIQSIAGLILVTTANLIVKKISPENSMF